MESPFVIETGEQTHIPIVAGVINREALIAAINRNDPRKAIGHAGRIYMESRTKDRKRANIEVPEKVEAPDPDQNGTVERVA